MTAPETLSIFEMDGESGLGAAASAVNSLPRILFVDQTGELGGAELCLADLAIHLRNSSTVFLFESGPFQKLLEAKGVQTVVPKAGVSPTKVGKNATLVAYLLAIPAFIQLAITLIRVAKGQHMLYANTAKALVVTAIAGLVLRKPFLIHLHDIVDTRHFNRLNRWLLVTAANLANGVVANSEATAAAYRAAGGNNRNLAVVRNGFEVNRFLAEPESPHQAVRTAIGAENKPLIGLFGRITAWKGQKVLIEAIRQLPEVHALIVGEALFTDEDRRYRQSLTDLAAQLGLAGRVHFAGFQLDIVPFLKAVDLVVHCSTSPEPFGRVIVEAQLAGKPVIATKGGASAEIVDHRVTGILVNPDDPEGLAGAIQQILENRSWADELAVNGQRTARERFALDGVLKDWTDFIHRSVPSRPPGAPATEGHPEKCRGFTEPTAHSKMKRKDGRKKEVVSSLISKLSHVNPRRKQDAVSDRP